MHLVAQPCLTLRNPIDGDPPGSSIHTDSPGKNTGIGGHALLPGDLPNPGVEPGSPALQMELNYLGSPAVNIGVIYLFELWLSADV